LSYTIDIGAAPANAECAQLGQTPDFERVNRFEIDAYRIAIIAIHGLPPEGCRLTSKPNQHDFGTYRTLVLQIDNENDTAVSAYAEAVEDGLDNWHDAGMAPPIDYDGVVARIPRPQLDEVVIGALLTTRPAADGRFAIPHFETLHNNLAAAFPECAESAQARLSRLVDNPGEAHS